MATREQSAEAVDQLALNVRGGVSVAVESDDGAQLVRVQSSSARVSVCAHVDETATADDVAGVLRDLAAELEYQTGAPDQGGSR